MNPNSQTFQALIAKCVHELRNLEAEDLAKKLEELQHSLGELVSTRVKRLECYKSNIQAIRQLAQDYRRFAEQQARTTLPIGATSSISHLLVQLEEELEQVLTSFSLPTIWC